MDDINGKELLVMNEEVRKQELEKYGAITYCEKCDVLCFGCLTEDGSCKYEVCLHDDPKWIEQQKRIEEKRKSARMEAEKFTHEPQAKKVNQKDQMAIIRNLEAKARSLYMAGEHSEANKIFNKAKKARKALWDITHND